MSLTTLIGQPLAVELSQKWLAQNTNNPLLFFGPEGVGKKTLALELAKILNCHAECAKNPTAQPCVSCRKIAAGNHPDVRVVDFAWQALIRDEDLEKQQNLKIETILAERHRLLQSPLEGRRKVLILDDAHRLTPDAANAFLKVLEEPPADAIIFLLTPFRDRLLPTIISRCRPVRFRALSDQEMREWQTRAGLPELDLWLTRGSPGRALHLIREEALSDISDAENLWNSLPNRSAVDIVSNAEGRTKGARVTRPDMEEKIKTLMVPAARALRSGNSSRAMRALPAMENALQRLRHNGSPSLVYEDLLITLAKDA
jgi:DNA polymerase III delta prime subunit